MTPATWGTPSPTSASTSCIGTWSTSGHDVVYVQNLTDVDDDMLRKARELGEDYLALGNRHVTPS